MHFSSNNSWGVAINRFGLARWLRRQPTPNALSSLFGDPLRNAATSPAMTAVEPQSDSSPACNIFSLRFNTWVVSAHSLALKPVWFVTKFSTASWQCRCWAIDSFGILLAISLPPSRSLLVTQHLSATASHTSFLPNADWIPLPRHPLFLRFSSSPPRDCLILIHSHWFFPHLLRILHSAESPSTHLGASLSHQPPRILLFFPAAPRLRGLRASLDPSWRLGNSCLIHSPEGTPLNVVND